MMSAAVAGGVSKFVYCSSMARYGTNAVPFTEDMTPAPQDPYGIAKVSSELLVRNLADTHGLAHAVLVPHNIIGPRQRFTDPFRNVASIMTNRMLAGVQPIVYGDGSQRRCFSFVGDVVAPMMRACTTDAVDGLVVNIGPDEEFVSILSLAGRLARIIGFDLDPIFMPGRPQEVKDANCSADRARELLGYSTSTSLDAGLTELVEWIAAHGPKPFDYHLPIEFATAATPRTWTDQLI
jgi:UDP-glucose 4-epimerase